MKAPEYNAHCSAPESIAPVSALDITVYDMQITNSILSQDRREHAGVFSNCVSTWEQIFFRKLFRNNIMMRVDETELQSRLSSVPKWN